MNVPIDAERGQKILYDCLSFPSPQPDAERVRAFITQVVQPRLRTDLFDEVVLDGKGNLLARKRGKAGQKPFLVYTYAGTYPAESMADPYPAQLLGEGPDLRLRGRGAAEQRSGLAAAIEAVNVYLAGRPVLSRGLDFVTNVAGEMGNHLVAAELVETQGLVPHAVIIAVASDNELCLGNLGRVDVHITIQGRSAHSSDPSAGVNALEGARLLLNRLAALPMTRVDPELGRATLAPTFLETAPRASHTIPSRATLTLDRRLLPGDEIPAVMADIEACAQDLGKCQAEGVAGHFNYPNKVSPEAEIARKTAEAMRSAGIDPNITYKRSALDGGYFTRSGADCVVFGPGDPRLGHSDEEYVSVRQAVQAAEVYRRLFALVCA